MGCVNARSCVVAEHESVDATAGRKTKQKKEEEEADIILKDLVDSILSTRRIFVDGDINLPKLSAGSSSEALCTSTAAYLAERILDESWIARHDDVAYYCKTPLALLEAGMGKEATESLKRAARYMKRGGAGSQCVAYRGNHVQAPWLWICWAASRLQCEDVVELCYKTICRFRDPMTDTGLAKAPYQKFGSPAHEFDFFATAVLCKAAMLHGSWQVATGAADSMLRTIEANRLDMPRRRRFRLRWKWDSGFVEDDKDPFCIVDQVAPGGQLYALLGFPAVVLLELAGREQKLCAAYTAGAQTLLTFLRGCVGLASSPSASVVVHAATLAGDTNLATKLTTCLVKQAILQEVGSETPESMDWLADTCIWLAQASKVQAASPEVQNSPDPEKEIDQVPKEGKDVTLQASPDLTTKELGGARKKGKKVATEKKPSSRSTSRSSPQTPVPPRPSQRSSPTSKPSQKPSQEKREKGKGKGDKDENRNKGEGETKSTCRSSRGTTPAPSRKSPKP